MERRIQTPVSPRQAIYGGSLRSAGRDESQLEFFDWGIRLQRRTVFGRLSDCYEIRYEELNEAGLTGKLLSRGIHFRSNFLPEPTIFLTVDHRAILDRLEQRGVTVNRHASSRLNAMVPRGFQIVWLSVAVPLLLLAVGAEIIPTLIGAQENFHTLRSDLSQVHLPAGYHLTAVRKAGTDCHRWCSLTQIWKWAPGNGRAPASACADASHAMSSAFSPVDLNSPLPANVACDYYVILDSLAHPGQGKRSIDAIVQAGTARADGSSAVKLVASYGIPG